MVAYTGLGSLPGVDIGGALRACFDLDYAYLPELPARGPWAGMIGRGLGLPGGLSADLSAGEWRLVDAPGIDQRRSRATWRDDLELVEQFGYGYQGRFKVAITGPWTLAASLGVAHVGRVLADPGARRDLAQSMAESAAALVADVQRRLPQAELVLQLDEPSLPAVAAGAVPTPGGYFRHRAIDLPELITALGWISSAVQSRVVHTAVHSCAAWRGPGDRWPLRALQAAGVGAISLDLDQLGGADLEAVAEFVEAAGSLYLGVLPTVSQPAPLAIDAVRSRALTAVERIGVGAQLAPGLVLTPACGLAGWQPAQVERGFAVLGRVAGQVADELH